MPQYLLDTHTLLWSGGNTKSLSLKASEIIINPTQICLVSIVSYWELTIKSGLKKLDLPVPIEDLKGRAEHSGIETLQISTEYLTILHDLPLHHRDPFDRLLIATAIAENIPIISRDGLLDSYDIVRIW